MRTTRKKVFFGILFFAFSWVVIGDLVQFHLDLIYGKNASDWHQPFTKAPKGATYKKVKEDHSGAKGAAVLPAAVHWSFSTAIAGEVYLADDHTVSFYFSPGAPLRAPPSFC
jgi:hypothetical protein